MPQGRSIRPYCDCTWLYAPPDSGCESIPTLPRRSGPAAIMFAGSPKMTNPKASAKHHRLAARSEEHTSELQSLMRNSYAVFCLKKKTTMHMIVHSTRTYHANTIILQ